MKPATPSASEVILSFLAIIVLLLGAGVAGALLPWGWAVLVIIVVGVPAYCLASLAVVSVGNATRK